MSCLDLVKATAQRCPHVPALLSPGRATQTFGGLWQQIEEVRAALRACGVAGQTRIGLEIRPGPDSAVALLGSMATGVCAPFDHAAPQDACAALFERQRIAACIVHGEDSTGALAARSLGIPVLRVGRVDSGPVGAIRLVEAHDVPVLAAPSADADRLILLLHTSGTTGRPHVVPIHDSNLLFDVRMRLQRMNLTQADRCLGLLPLFSRSGIVHSLLLNLAAGGACVFLDEFSAPTYFGAVDAFGVTWSSMPPATLAALVEEIESGRATVPRSLRFLRSSSSALPIELEARAEAAFAVPLIQGYGMTEAGGVAQNPLPPGPRRSGSVGLSLGMEIAIVDDAGVALDAGSIGTVCVRGAGVTPGYENDDDANRQAFAGGWFRTGDIGYRDSDGYLFLCGRARERINRGGRMIDPLEIDHVLLRHTAVCEAAAFGVPHLTLDEDLVAAVVLRPDAVAAPSALRAFCAEHLASHKVPSQVLVVDHLPRNARQKIVRGRLAADFADRLRPDFVAPDTPLEDELAGIVAEVLGRDAVGATDNFFALGGDSLSAARALARINAAHGVQLPMTAWFQRPTVRDLAVYLQALECGFDASAPVIGARPRGA